MQLLVRLHPGSHARQGTVGDTPGSHARQHTPQQQQRHGGGAGAPDDGWMMMDVGNTPRGTERSAKAMERWTPEDDEMIVRFKVKGDSEFTSWDAMAAAMVGGLYKLNPVDPQRESAWLLRKVKRGSSRLRMVKNG
jgi:hypothetical protein